MEEKIKKIRSAEIFDQHLAGRLKAWLGHVGITEEAAARCFNTVRPTFLSEKSIFEVERELHELFVGSGFNDGIQQGLRNEEEMVFGEVRDFVQVGSCLDVGAGSGHIARKIQAAGHPTQLVDVIDFNQTELPAVIYDGKTLPFDSDSYDNVTLLTVLHHCDHPLAVLRESIRVAKRRIIIIESLHVSDSELLSNMFFDWLWNRVVYQDVNVPFNFLSPQEWTEVFRKEKVSIAHSIDLGYDSPMTPEHHWLFVLDKKDI